MGASGDVAARKLELHSESAEHAFIGDQLILEFPSGKITGKEFAFEVKDQTISFGDVIFLAGDFYANWSVLGDAEQISDKWLTDPAASITRFKKNAETLATDSPGYLKKVLAVMADERRIIMNAVKEGKDPAQEYERIADDFNRRYALATLWRAYPAYLSIALCNFDHFGQDAIYAYKAGHTAALAQAKKAHGTKRLSDLRYAYFLEGFALHFFTDLFSSGHLRPPRRVLHTVHIATPGLGEDRFALPNLWPGDACAKEFHDEDCANGLFVTNSLNESWAMYGDGQLFNSKNVENLSKVVQASQIAVDEIWKVYQTGDDNPSSLFAPLKWVADLTKLDYPKQFAPLFTYNANTKVLSMRAKLEERANPETKVVQQGFLGFQGALAEIKASGTHRNRLPLTRDFQPANSLIQLQKIDNSLYMSNKYGPLKSTDYSGQIPTEITRWNILSRNTPPFKPDGSNWASPSYLSKNFVLAVTGKEPGAATKTGYAGYKLDFSNTLTNPIDRLWELAVSTPAKTPDTAIPGTLSTESEDTAFTPAPAGALNKLLVFDQGIEMAPVDRSQLTTTGEGLMIREPININEQGLPGQLLARSSVIDNNSVKWTLYGWKNNYGTQLNYESQEQSVAMPGEQWWRYVTGGLLNNSKTTQIVRLLYGDHAEKDSLRVDVLEVKGNPPKVSQASTNKYKIALWGSPTEDRYVKWLLLDVSQDGNLDLVTLINTDESTLTIVVFPSKGDYAFGNPTISQIRIPDTTFNPAFFKPISAEPTVFEYPTAVKANTGILQLFDNYGVLGARLLAPVGYKDLNYELKGQMPAIAGQMSVGAGPSPAGLHLDNCPGFLTQPV